MAMSQILTRKEKKDLVIKWDVNVGVEFISSNVWWAGAYETVLLSVLSKTTVCS